MFEHYDSYHIHEPARPALFAFRIFFEALLLPRPFPLLREATVQNDVVWSRGSLQQGACLFYLRLREVMPSYVIIAAMRFTLHSLDPQGDTSHGLISVYEETDDLVLIPPEVVSRVPNIT